MLSPVNDNLNVANSRFCGRLRLIINRLMLLLIQIVYERQTQKTTRLKLLLRTSLHYAPHPMQLLLLLIHSALINAALLAYISRRTPCEQS